MQEPLDAEKGMMLAAGDFYYYERQKYKFITREAHGESVDRQCRFLVGWERSFTSEQYHKWVSVTVGWDEALHIVLHAHLWANGDHTEAEVGNPVLYTCEGEAIPPMMTVRQFIERGGVDGDTLFIRNTEPNDVGGCIKILNCGGCWEMVHNFRRGATVADLIGWCGYTCSTHMLIDSDGKTVLGNDVVLRTSITQPMLLQRKST